MTRAPAHAGSLRLTERLAFVMMFTVMAAFVVGLSVVAAKTGVSPGLPPVAGSAGTNPVGSGVEPLQSCPSSKDPVAARVHETRPAHPSGPLDARLTRALRATLRQSRAQLSVGVIDMATGAEALYRAHERYHAAGVAGTDILAALLYQHQQARTPITKQDTDLAVKMIEKGSGPAAARLWRAIGRGAGLVAANQALGLRHTIPGMADAWALTRTTTADQLQLLTDLATNRSALESTCRSYELSLLGSVTATQHWGVPAAARAHTRYAVSDAWQPDPRRFVVNSLGVIDHGPDELLVVVLSQGWQTKAAGISAVRTAAIAAATAMPRSS